MNINILNSVIPNKVICFVDFYSCSIYAVEPERTNIYNEVMKHYLNFEEYPRALCLAMSVNDTDTMTKIFVACQDP